jgi:hypothetical protein
LNSINGRAILHSVGGDGIIVLAVLKGGTPHLR